MPSRVEVRGDVRVGIVDVREKEVSLYNERIRRLEFESDLGEGALLEVLNVSQNNLRADGGKALAGSLATNQSITTVSACGVRMFPTF